MRGTVKFEDDSPVMFGTIEFQSNDESLNARGKIKRDGSFVIGTYREDDGAIAGTHKVVITQLITNHFHIEVEHDHGDLVHQKYSRYRTSDLEVVVEEKDNQLVLVVDKKNE